ncbi:hypothetical protein [Rathayibacter rathayi]|uniref:Uncharacterized protein n=1 Tax=Rathayibacter rathayi TaxID=33887 RepID=A0ABX5AGJ2_RATRA|nr:hypothetical protein [Rathayibacter rathayi]PPF24293.1 hypothetical protein C5C34_06075 [Rathayibacter rathayi]PPF51614.1 hypothetical protein C5C08_02065 [Rathayibacter rathayi]PPF83205.1 hypothetical protein C5C14_02105 [Rathayibacter rathayi]PPG47035.1 hypothetical protein C5C20_02060 [Rathayibacter rathayi]PPG96504.1 hypothetical protein C5C22_02465 [Rathayibacter rathayi]
MNTAAPATAVDLISLRGSWRQTEKFAESVPELGVKQRWAAAAAAARTALLEHLNARPSDRTDDGPRG